MYIYASSRKRFIYIYLEIYLEQVSAVYINRLLKDTILKFEKNETEKL